MNVEKRQSHVKSSSAPWAGAPRLRGGHDTRAHQGGQAWNVRVPAKYWRQQPSWRSCMPKAPAHGQGEVQSSARGAAQRGSGTRARQQGAQGWKGFRATSLT
jgi:hypothetical protein